LILTTDRSAADVSGLSSTGLELGLGPGEEAEEGGEEEIGKSMTRSGASALLFNPASVNLCCGGCCCSGRASCTLERTSG
jgi:hypothetical protein